MDTKHVSSNYQKEIPYSTRPSQWWYYTCKVLDNSSICGVIDVHTITLYNFISWGEKKTQWVGPYAPVKVLMATQNLYCIFQ